MKTWSARAILIVALVVLYALVAFPLPYLLLDHSSAMQAGDDHHSDRDGHAWLKWACRLVDCRSSAPGASLARPADFMVRSLGSGVGRCV